MLCITELAEHSSNDVELKGAPGFVYALSTTFFLG